MNILYACWFFSYTNNVKDKTLAWAQMGYSGAFTVAALAYSYMENPRDLPFRYGILTTIVLFYFVGSPFLRLVSDFTLHNNHEIIANVLIYTIFRVTLSVVRVPKDYHSRSFSPERWFRFCGCCTASSQTKCSWFSKMVSFSLWVPSSYRCSPFIHQNRWNKRKKRKAVAQPTTITKRRTNCCAKNVPFLNKVMKNFDYFSMPSSRQYTFFDFVMIKMKV